MTGYLGKKPISSYIPTVNVNYPKIKQDETKIKKLFQLVQNNNIDDLKSFVEENKLTWSVIDEDEQTLLHSVLDNDLDPQTEKENINKLLTVKFLIAQGVNIDHANQYGITLLHLAINQQNAPITHLILDMRANIDVQDNHGMTPIHYAVIGLKKKAEPIRRIKSIITDNQENKKIRNQYLSTITDTIITILQKSDKLKYFENILKNYDYNNKEKYNTIIIDGFMKKIVDIMANREITEFKRKQEFEDNITAMKHEIETDMREKVNGLITTNEDFSNKIFIDQTAPGQPKDDLDSNYSEKYLQHEILALDKKIYQNIETLYNKITSSHMSLIQPFIEKIEQLFDYYSKIISQRLDVGRIILWHPNNFDSTDPTKPFGKILNDINKDAFAKYVTLLNQLYDSFIESADHFHDLELMLNPKEVITDNLNLHVIQNEVGERIMGNRVYELELYEGPNANKYLGKIIFNIPAIFYEQTVAQILKERYFKNLNKSLVRDIPDGKANVEETNDPLAPVTLPDIEEYFRNSTIENNHYTRAYEFFINNEYPRDEAEDKENEDDQQLYEKSLLFVPTLVSITNDGKFIDNPNFRFEINDNTNNNYRIKLRTETSIKNPPLLPAKINFCMMWYKQPETKDPSYDEFLMIERKYQECLTQGYFTTLGDITDANLAQLRAGAPLTDQKDIDTWKAIRDGIVPPTSVIINQTKTNTILDNIYFKQNDKFYKFNTHVIQMGELHNRVGFQRDANIFSNSNLTIENVIKIERKMSEQTNYTREDFYSIMYKLKTINNKVIKLINTFLEEKDNLKQLYQNSKLDRPTEKTFKDILALFGNFNNAIDNTYNDFKVFPGLYNKLDALKWIYRNNFTPNILDFKASPILTVPLPAGHNEYYGNIPNYDFIIRIMRLCNYILPNTYNKFPGGVVPQNVTHNPLLKKYRTSAVVENELDIDYMNPISLNNNIPFQTRLSLFYTNIPELNPELSQTLVHFNNAKQSYNIQHNVPELFWFQHQEEQKTDAESNEEDKKKLDAKHDDPVQQVDANILNNAYNENINVMKMTLFNEIRNRIKNIDEYKNLLKSYMMENNISPNPKFNPRHFHTNSNGRQLMILYDTMLYKLLESILHKHFSMYIEHAANTMIRKKYFNYFKKEYNDKDGNANALTQFVFDTKEANSIFDTGFPERNFILGLDAPIKTSLSVSAGKNFEKTLRKLNTDKPLREYMNLTEPLSTVVQEYVYNVNYTNETPIYEKRQQVINMNIIIDLLKRDVNLSLKNNDDNLPIHLAIESLRTDTVKKLLVKKSKLHGDKSKNRKGLTPYNYCLVLFKNHLDVFYNDLNKKSSQFVMAINKGFVKMLYDRVDNRNNVPLFIEQALPMSILMFNMYLYYDVFTQYKDGWTYENQKNFVKLINKYTQCQARYPYMKSALLNLTDDNITLLGNNGDDDSISNTYSEFEAALVKERDELENKNHSIDLEIESIQDELKDYTGIDVLSTKRITALNMMITSLQTKKGTNDAILIQLQNDIAIVKTKKSADQKVYSQADIIAKIQELLEELADYNDTNSVEKLNSIERLNIITEKFKEQYDYLENEKKNVDYDNYQHGPYKTYASKKSGSLGIPSKKREDYNRFYNSLWKNLFNRNTMFTNSLEFLHLHVNDMLHNIVSDTSIKQLDTVKINELKEDLALIQRFYKYNVVDIITEYENNITYYRENKITTCIVDITTHIVDSIVTNNMYAMIVKFVSLSLLETDRLDQEDLTLGFGENMITKIIESVYQNYTIEGFMSKDNFTLPIVKRTLEIYEQDDEAENLNIQNYMEFICSIIINNPVHPIPESGSIIQNIKKYIIPYYKNVYSLLIPLIRQVIENYTCYLFNESKHVGMLLTLIEAVD